MCTISITGNFAGTTTCGRRLAAGASCTISVTFTPRAAGALTGTLTIGTIGTVALSGTGQAPSASITPTTFAFANQQVGTASVEQVFTYTNTGPVPITVATVMLGCAAATLAPSANAPAAAQCVHRADDLSAIPLVRFVDLSCEYH